MRSFTYYNPTHVLFGKDVASRVGMLLQRDSVHKIALHYGGGSAERSGLLDQVRRALHEAKIEWIELGGVRPNPRYEDVCHYTADCIQAKVDFILAVGGGSVIDSAKAIAAAVKNQDVDIWEAACGRAKVSGALPIGVILTIAAAGSETSPTFVLSNESEKAKRAFSADFLRPRFALMDPTLTYSLSKWQKGCAAADILMHSLERYFSPVEGNLLTDRLSEAVMKTVVDTAPICLQDPSNYDAHSELMWAGSLAHCNLTGLGGVDDWATHQLGHTLSAIFDYSHGATLTATWGAWARYVIGTEGTSRFVQYATNIWNVTCQGKSQKEVCLEGIQRTEEFFQCLDLPISLADLCGKVLTDAEIRQLARNCSYQGSRTIGNYRILDEEAIYSIYMAANH